MIYDMIIHTCQMYVDKCTTAHKTFHMSVLHSVACAIEVTINTVYATLLCTILYW
jgi:hypothetical protein